jgi:hypothetical protein
MVPEPLICVVEIPRGTRNRTWRARRSFVDGWRSKEEALAEIEASRERSARSEAQGRTPIRGPGGRLPGPERQP